MLFSSLCSAQDSLLLADNHHTIESSDSVIVKQLREKGIRFSHNNSVTLLMNGQEKFVPGHPPGKEKCALRVFQLPQRQHRRLALRPAC